MAEQLALLPGYLTAHLQLTLTALSLGALVSVPAGIWIARRPRLEPALLGLASVIQTIPSLALLAIMVPTLAGLGALAAALFGVELRSIGFLPALAALSLYSLLPILRNTVTGIGAVDPALVEAARGVGMTDRQRLRRVELPLAMPVIVAGIRTAAVWVVGTATLSTPVGATSLGNFIFSGLQTRNHIAVWVGCAAAAGLALLLDRLIHALESGARRGSRLRLAAGLAGLLALFAYTGASLALERLHAPERLVRIGSKTFTEQYVLAEILGQRIAERTGAAARPVPSLGSTVAFEALRAGEIDLYVDYSGTLWATIMKRRTRGDRASILDEVGRYLREEHGVALLGALGFENRYALAMRDDRARELGVRRIGDLARVAPGLEIGGDYEFFHRAEWAALVEAYGLAFAGQRSMDSSLMYQAVAGREVDVISAFSTDGRIAALGLVLLEDDRGAIPPYDAIVLGRPHLAEERPRVVEALTGLLGRIDAERMRRMNLAVDRDGREPAEVAREFLAGLRSGRGSRSSR